MLSLLCLINQLNVILILIPRILGLKDRQDKSIYSIMGYGRQSQEKTHCKPARLSKCFTLQDFLFPTMQQHCH